MKEAIEFLLKLAQEKLQSFKGKTAMKAIEDLLEIQCNVKTLPPPMIYRQRKPEQLCFWYCDKSLLSSKVGGRIDRSDLGR